MPKFLTDIFKMVMALVVLMLGAEKPDSGPEKRATVVAEIEKIMDEPGGIDWPSFVPKDSFRPWLLGLLVDQLVKLLNRSGFFGK